MATSRKVLREGLKANYLDKVSEFLANYGEEVLRTGSNEIALPVVDAEGNDDYLVITFKVPTGSRDGEPYDAYSVAEDYSMKQKAKAEKAEIAAKKKAEKIAKDAERRQKMAEAKAAREAEKEKG